VDGRGKIVKEAKVASEPEALVCFFNELGFPVDRIGFEAGPLSQWLHAGSDDVDARGVQADGAGIAQVRNQPVETTAWLGM
jgi:hypothetical protein